MSRRRQRRRGGGGRDRSPGTGFWGQTGRRSTPPEPIRPTPDPAALLRSLGDPPLAPAAASQQLAVVYEEAVRAATALAAANDLLDTDPDPDDEGHD